MTDFQAVSKALAGGADPAMLCATCPWDRNCVTPPTMTTADVEAQIAEAARKDDEHLAQARIAGVDPGLPTGSLLTALVVGGRDTSAQVCPVFALRLKSSGGREIADSIRSSMQAWDDAS